jgi:hypothetical protein
MVDPYLPRKSERERKREIESANVNAIILVSEKELIYIFCTIQSDCIASPDLSKLKQES